jgi:hypothetical protein
VTADRWMRARTRPYRLLSRSLDEVLEGLAPEAVMRETGATLVTHSD